MVIKYPYEDQLTREAVYFGLQFQGGENPSWKTKCGSTKSYDHIASALRKQSEHQGPYTRAQSSKAQDPVSREDSKALPPKGFLVVPSSTVSWGPSVLIHECMRSLLQTNHTMWALHECQLMSLWSRVVSKPREGIWPVGSFKQWLPGENEHIQYARKFSGCFICYLPLDVILHICGIPGISVLVVFILLWSNTMTESNLNRHFLDC